MKNPHSSNRSPGILAAADTLHSLILEDRSVKIIQAGFLTLGSSYSLRLPIPLPFNTRERNSGFCKFRPRLQRRVRPRIPQKRVTGFPWLGYDNQDRYFITSPKCAVKPFLLQSIFVLGTLPAAHHAGIPGSCVTVLPPDREAFLKTIDPSCH